MADGVANQVSQGLGDGVENAFVEIGVLPAEHEFDLAAALPGNVAHHARKAAEQLVHRHHANLHDRALQIVEHPRLESHGIGKFAAQQLFGITLGEFVQRLLQHRLADNQFADQVQHAVDAPGFHPQDVLLQRVDAGSLGHRGRKYGRLSRTLVRIRLIFTGKGCWCGHRPVGRFLRSWTGGEHQLDRHFLGDGGNASLGRDLFDGLRAGQHEFDLLGSGRRLGVRANRYHLPHSAQGVVDQLAPGNGHGAVRIDLDQDVIDGQAAGLRLGHGQFFVLGPGCGGLGGGFGRRCPGCRGFACGLPRCGGFSRPAGAAVRS